MEFSRRRLGQKGTEGTSVIPPPRGGPRDHGRGYPSPSHLRLWLDLETNGRRNQGEQNGCQTREMERRGRRNPGDGQVRAISGRQTGKQPYVFIPFAIALLINPEKTLFLQSAFLSLAHRHFLFLHIPSIPQPSPREKKTRKVNMSVIDILTRVDAICNKYDIDKKRDLNVSGDDAFARLYAAVEADIKNAIQVSRILLPVFF
ncbi:syntaxin of plants 71 [Actinidia rufa]|uniref:Syntaxin of plants 71 n=1 Tax=Actinidia rufa TaxID=165716 RepID=A0A7J0GK52_9ERIC|nr:syntaxin of plants 71 [Actinidia rufa]